MHIKDCPLLDEYWEKWAYESRINYDWVVDYIETIFDEHLYRFHKPHVVENLRGKLDCYHPKMHELNYMTPIDCDIIPESCVQLDTPTTFRNWYSRAYGSTHHWTKRKTPIWIKEVALAA
jgi:hypothetical protein